MATRYPTLRRPKRKLCYLTNKESVTKEWTGTMTLGDVDRMFDDLDSPSLDDGQLQSTTLHQVSDTETNSSDREVSTVPQEEHLTTDAPVFETKSASPELDVESDMLFQMDGPVKTSSPIEKPVDIEGVEEVVSEEKQVVSPIIFGCDDDGREEAIAEPLTIQEPQLSGVNSELESPPSRFAFNKPTATASVHKKDELRHENTDKPISAARQEPVITSPDQPSTSFHNTLTDTSTHVAKDKSAFLQMLRGAGKPKPTCSRKLLTPVKVTPPPPEPEDDFLILEDDAPLLFSIPSKSATSKKQKQSGSASTDKESSTDQGTKDGTQETVQKEEESEKTKGKLGMEPVNQKMKRKKGREKKNEVTGPGNSKDDVTSPKDHHLREQDKPNQKKKQLKKISSKDTEKAKEKTTDSDSGEIETSPKTKTKSQESFDVKRSKPSKKLVKNDKTSRVKSLKGTRMGNEGREDVRESVYDEAVKDQREDKNNKKHANVEMDFPTGRSDGPGESSPEEGQILGKRKRKQTGQWWLSHPQSTEETEVTESPPTIKRSKKHIQEPSTSGVSSVKTKDKVLKRRKKKQGPVSPRPNTSKAKETKIKHTKKQSARGGTPKKMNAIDEAEQTEDQQLEALDQDLDPVQSSPLVLTHRDSSLNSGDQVFQRVYQVSKERTSNAPVSPRAHLEPPCIEETGKRIRKPPGNWWMTTSMSEEVESTSSQPQRRLKIKSSKRGKKLSQRSRSPRPGSPKNGNVTVSSKPLGGARELLLQPKPMSAPKTVKRSLAMFKDIFRSVSETPTAVSSRDAGRNYIHNVTAGPDEEVTDRVTHNKTDQGLRSLDAGELRSTQNSTFQPEQTLKGIRSGPSSILEVDDYEQMDHLILPPPSVPAALCISDLCGPPLKPLILQRKDKANLTEWFKSLWSSSVDTCCEITPDQFDWYFYQGRAMGFLVDLNCDSICNGKILLGSYMKKPLWVDHSATTVFNLLTSSVKVTIDGRKSHFSAGQSFMVQCGHAYSIQNSTAQPAVLYFTRILEEISD